MTSSLPERPSLEYLKKRAKDVLKAHDSGNPTCCGILRRLHRYVDATEKDILAAKFTLKDVQFALAMEYGFTSWEKLRENVDGAAVPSSFRALDDVFQGDLMKTDTFSLSVHAAASLLGNNFDYETAWLFSTNPFSLALCHEENCTAWWHMYGRGTYMDFVGQALGLKIHRLELPDIGVYPNMPADELAEVTRRTKQQIEPILRRHWRNGDMLITEGGWQVTDGPYGFIPWCHWGVITQANDETLFGATLGGSSYQGHWDTPLVYLQDVYVVQRTETAMAASTARTELLQRAVTRIRGENLPSHNQTIHFGLDGMDLWIRHMQRVESFCEACGERGWRCATATANAMISGAKVAADWLAEQAGHVQPKAGELLSQASDAYRSICRRIEPALSDGEEGYRNFIGNMEKQRKYAKDVLTPIRHDLDNAATAMEKAMSFME